LTVYFLIFFSKFNIFIKKYSKNILQKIYSSLYIKNRILVLICKQKFFVYSKKINIVEILYKFEFDQKKKIEK